MLACEHHLSPILFGGILIVLALCMIGVILLIVDMLRSH